MPYKELVLKSKAQAEKLRQEFTDRYGKEEGEKKFREVEARSPKIEDLPERVPVSFHHSKRRINLSRKFGGHWRGV